VLEGGAKLPADILSRLNISRGVEFNHKLDVQ
jgi:hypothetical protein